MSTFPNSPRLLKGGIVLMDPDTGVIERVITLQYNPDTLTRTLQVQAIETGHKDRSDALRLKGPAVETIKLDVEIDATDQLEFPDQNRGTAQFGVFPQLSALEMVVTPSVTQLQNTNSLGQAGALEIAPVEAPLSLFVWSRSRVVPMRITDFSITEEAFDANLNPIRAKVSLTMRVLSVEDLGYEDRGGNLFLAYQQQKERLASLSRSGALRDLGIGGIP